MNQIQNNNDIITYDHIIGYLCPSSINKNIDKLDKFNDGDNLYYCIKKFLESKYNNYSYKDLISNINKIRNITEKELNKISTIFNTNIIIFNFNNIYVNYHQKNPLEKNFLLIKKDKLYYLLLNKNNNPTFNLDDNIINDVLNSKDINIKFNYDIVSENNNLLNNESTDITKLKKDDVIQPIENNNNIKKNENNNLLNKESTDITKLKKFKKDELCTILDNNKIEYNKKLLKEKLCILIVENNIEIK